MGYKPRIVRTWIARLAIYTWSVLNEPPRTGWAETGGVKAEDQRKYGKAWSWCHEQNGAINE